MLELTVIVSDESFDESTNKFVYDSEVLEFEHSLASLSKWESYYEKPFLNNEEKTTEETLFYITKCMLQTKNPPADFAQRLTQKNVLDIQNYINGKQTATWFTDKKSPGRGSSQTITAEVIYGWMVALDIPLDTQYWHLNKLLTLVKVCNEQKKPPKKMSRTDEMRQRAALNARRQAEMGTRG